MLNSIPAADADRLRNYLLESGYTEKNLNAMGISELPSRRLRNLPGLLDITREPTPLNTLLRWFWLGVRQEAATTEGLLPQWVIRVALDSGLLRREGTSLVPQVMLVHIGGFLIASDHTSAIDRGDSNLVLWPNPTSKLLSRFSVRRPSSATLDLGAGNGILGLTAASYSQRVVATDLNDRATACAAFNARLNGIENIECLTGDGFAPVTGQTFDLILSNPPFFITPSSQYMFCENPAGLDFLCRRLVREAPSHLNEGGYFQMLCEWAQIAGQPWQERLAEWFQGIECDVWVLHGGTHALPDYAQNRITETGTAPDKDAELYGQYMSYYRDKGVEAIHAGLIAIRRRSGQNWVVIEEVANTPNEPFGESVQLTFAARDFLQSHASDETMWAVKPRISPVARLESIFRQSNSQWQPASLTLRLTEGFPFFVEVQPIVADFLGRCDGTRALADLAKDLAARLKKPVEAVQPECLAIVRKMIERGFLLC